MGDSASMTSSQASSLMEASMATSAVSSIATGFENAAAIKAQGNYQTSVANVNSAIAKLRASQTIQAGDIVAARKKSQTRQEVGAFRAAAGGSGIDVNVGSPATVQSSVQTAGDMDVLTIKNNAARAAWGYRTQEIQDSFEGQFSQLTAKSKATQSVITGGLSAISNPLAMASQAALWRYRYGLKGTSGVPYPSGGSGVALETDDGFWDRG